MPRQDEIEVFGIVDGVEDGEDGTSGVANWSKTRVSAALVPVAALYVQICLTPCLSIISWNISPPFMPTKVWSICCGGTACCASACHFVLSLLKAGEGIGLGFSAAAVLCPRFNGSEAD